MKSYLQKPTRKLYLFFLKKIPKCSKKVRNILVFSRIRYSQVICTLHNRFSYMLLLKVVLKFIMFFQSEVFDVTSTEYHEASAFIDELKIFFSNSSRTFFLNVGYYPASFSFMTSFILARVFKVQILMALLQI